MSGNQYFDNLYADGGFVGGDHYCIQWRDHAGIGFLNLQETPYDAAYFEKYVCYAQTEFGVQLNQARIDLVEKYCPLGSLVDVGIGSGQFMAAIGGYGFDINPVAVKLLEDNGRILNPYTGQVDCATFWDSLEHIADIADILKNVKKFCFVSIPIYEDLQHILSSKHYRPNEHCWYTTDEGFKLFMDAHGFSVVTQNTMETDLGRDGIGTYVLCRQEN